MGQQAQDSYGAAVASVLPAAQPAQDSYGSPSGASLAASGGLPAVASNQDSYGTPLSNVLPSSDAESLATVIEGRSAAGGASNLQQDALTQSTFQGGFFYNQTAEKSAREGDKLQNVAVSFTGGYMSLPPT